ncbi:MAG TPA: 23S rRNA (pseudouridine(1915)-N(3))-methyltransferase RlmH [Trueperaceae bacterium]|nr:23S rRNA (pseudouridine(1915)-N(3))-methyltransferase RlmH [Trueperaceae bacterium]
MRYKIISIGKIKEKYLKAGIEKYLKRIKNYGKIEIIELKEAKAKTRTEVQRIESLALLTEARNSYIVALDEIGQRYSSLELSKKITNLENSSISQVSFLIGGAEGHSPELKKKANLLLSLSKLTFAHEMVRLILLEQIYRIETIRSGHPYHRD